MKKSKLTKKFIEGLSKVPNISLVCESLTVSRQSFYRWMEEDIEFKEAVESALNIGVESINDLAESKLVSNIRKGSQRSAEFWLINNKRNYMKPRILSDKNGTEPETMTNKEKKALLALIGKVSIE